MIITLLLLISVGLGVFFFELKRSVRGYEDELGFHPGIHPESVEFLQQRDETRPAKRGTQKAANETVGQATLSLS